MRACVCLGGDLKRPNVHSVSRSPGKSLVLSCVLMFGVSAVSVLYTGLHMMVPHVDSAASVVLVLKLPSPISHSAFPSLRCTTTFTQTLRPCPTGGNNFPEHIVKIDRTSRPRTRDSCCLACLRILYSGGGALEVLCTVTCSAIGEATGLLHSICRVSGVPPLVVYPHLSNSCCILKTFLLRHLYRGVLNIMDAGIEVDSDGTAVEIARRSR
ncbi:hypothetical protein BJV77DRAFT_56258 [Russula vinacea]|jgi:hypothetical protein|nr:hypothetical protein BJV77DRAFT_56258 [Russula vinacea]